MRYDELPREINIAQYFLDHNPGDRTALISPAGATSYGELTELANRAGNALRGLGVGAGDRVLIALTDSVEYVAAWYGTQRIGAITAEVYSYLQPKDFRYFLDYVRPAVVLADRATLPGLRAAGATGLVTVGVPAAERRPGEHDFHDLAAAQPSTVDTALVAPDDVVMWKFTTGSTGAPKAVLVPARSPILSTDWYARGVLGIRPDDVVLPVPKLFFGYARDMVTLFPYAVGAAGVAFPERSTADRMFELIAEHRPTILVNVPTMMKAMLAHPAAHRQDLSSLRLCTSGGEALPAELHRRWLDTFGVEVTDSIGSCEAYHAYIANRPGQVRTGSLGQVVPGYRVRVVDAAGGTLPDGETGVLEVVGEPVALGYWQAPEKTAATFPAPYTLRTGDLFSRDPDGYFYYRGRADDLLKVSGVWVAPTEIEDCLLTHPAVAECAVVGYQVDGLTSTRAFVVAREPVTAADLQAYVRARLTPHKYPRDVRFVAALPETANGKLNRRALAEVG